MAKELNCSLISVRRYLKRYDISLKRGAPKNARWASFAKWLRENPDVTLPHSSREIAKITGCTEASIKNYIGRERWRAKNLVQSKPWKAGLNRLWISTRGFKISDLSFEEVHARISFTGRLKFTVKLKDGSFHIFIMTASQLEELYGV
jgi:hypothetical protein